MTSTIKYSRGFTLIELLVVISIISLLASVVFSASSNARAKARDAQRYSDIKQMRNALEIYKISTGSYPSSEILCRVPNPVSAVMPGWCNSIEPSTWATLETTLLSYIRKLPTDPKPGAVTDWGGSSNGGSYSYYSTGGLWYMIVYKLEKQTPTSPGVKDCSGGTYNYAGTGVMTVGMDCI